MLLVREIEEFLDRIPIAGRVRQRVRTERITPPEVGEEAHRAAGGGRQYPPHPVAVTDADAVDIRVGALPLDPSVACYDGVAVFGDDIVFGGVFDYPVRASYVRLAVCAERTGCLPDIRAHQRPLLVLGSKDGANVRGARQFVFQLPADFLDLHPGQSVEFDFEDGVGLFLVESEPVHEPPRRIFPVRGRTDELDGLVEGVEEFLEAAQDVNAPFEPFERVAEAAHHDLQAESQKGPQRLGEIYLLRSGDQRVLRRHETRHIDVVALLQVGMAEQVRDGCFRIGASPKFQHHADVVRRFVAHVGELRYPLVDDVLGDLLYERGLVDHVRNGGNDDPALPLHAVVAAQFHGPLPGPVYLQQLGGCVQDASGSGEIRSRHALRQLLDGRFRVVDQMNQRIRHLAQVMRGDFRGHADGDPVRPVDEEIRDARREHDRLVVAAVEIGPEIHGVLPDFFEHFHGQRAQLDLGVAHRGGIVPVDGAKVAVPVHQRVAQGEILRHPHHRVVYGRVAVGVILAHHFAHDRRALTVTGIGGKPQVGVHGVQNAPLHGLEAVADIRQGTAHDDGQRVAQIALPGRFLQGYGFDDGH